MNSKVDVLAVLDVLIQRSAFTGCDCELPLPEARAAVAELIEAAGEVAKFRLTSHGGPRLRAALARVTGA